MPEVSIGLPVFNGSRFLAEALDSLLGQSFGDFELIISDNASTDDTAEICADYARRDGRVRYIRQEQNIGATRNWNFVATCAQGEFFKWASANDTCAPQMLAQCVDVLRKNPHVVLCYGQTAYIDESGRTIRRDDRDLELLDERPSERYIRLRRELRMNNAQSGLIRLKTLLKTGLDRLYPAGDIVLMSELALLGQYKLLSEVLLYRRISRDATTGFLSQQELRKFLDPDSGSVDLASWRQHLDFVWSVSKSPIDLTEKLSALMYSLRCMVWDRERLWRELRARRVTS